MGSAAFIPVLFWQLLANPEPGYAMEPVGLPRGFEAEMIGRIVTPNHKAREWVVLAPHPPEVPGQKVLAAHFQSGGRPVAELSPLHRLVFLSHFKEEKWRKDFHFQFKYQVVLHERRLVKRNRAKPGPAPVPPLDEKQRKKWLTPTSLIDFESPAFQKWLKLHHLHRGPGEGDVACARRIFLHIANNFKYHYHSTMDRHADRTCRAGKSDCGGMSIVFVAGLRAQGIPARLRVGRWALSDREGEKLGDIIYHQQHVIAEFHARGVGWIPVDCSSAVVSPSRPRLDFFGHDRANFITLHLDHDLVVDSHFFGKQTVTWLQGVHFWVKGKGSLEGKEIRESWRVRKL